MDNRKTNGRSSCCDYCTETSSVPFYQPRIDTFCNNKGNPAITTYQVFPGIELSYYSVHTDFCCCGPKSTGDFIEIHHCREGCMEQKQENGCVYLMPGDLSVTIGKRCSSEFSFPIGHYHGIFISIDTNAAPECLACFLDDVNVSPKELAKRLCGKENCFVIRSQDYIEHIFSELYTVPESYKKGYLKVKILELLLVLGGIDPAENSVSSLTLSKIQIDIAKAVAAYLADNTHRNVTVAELAERYHVSQTHLQNAFKGLYGVPVSCYLRILKMESAALRLIHTDTAVLEIAAEFGYDNAGKFASAFRRIMGESPTEYRKMHSMLK